MTLSLKAAQTILSTALDACRKGNFKPMAVVVLDARGAVKVSAAEDSTSLKRFEVAHGKAFGALSLGMGSRSLFKRARFRLRRRRAPAVRVARRVGARGA